MENIEAMLCGYIEGDLDDAARAQIERHLQENPQHRKLIDDLLATRELVKSLPRVRAPMDVGDSLRGQVERSILLDDSAASAAPRETVSRLPHFMAIAAIFLLCAALFLILYKALGPTFKPPAYTENIAVKARPLTESDAPAQPLESQPQPGSAFAREAEAAKALADNNQNPSPDTGATEVPGLPAQFDLAALRGRLADAGYALASSENAAPLVLVVQGDDARATSADVAEMLGAAGVTWSRVPPTPIPNPALPVVATSVNQYQLAPTSQTPTTQLFQAAASNITPVGQQTGLTSAAQQYQTIATTRTASVGQLPRDSIANAGVAGTPNEDAPREGQAAILPTTDVYVLRGLTRDQASALRKNIAAADDVDALYVRDSVAVAATQPSAMVAAPGAAAPGAAALLSDKLLLRAAVPPGNARIGGFGGGGGGLAPTTFPTPTDIASNGNAALSNAAGNSTPSDEILNGANSLGASPDTLAPSKPLATVDAVIIVESSPPEPGSTTQPASSPSLNTTTAPAPADAVIPATQP
jgi:hypothetical protein